MPEEITKKDPDPVEAKIALSDDQALAEFLAPQEDTGKQESVSNLTPPAEEKKEETPPPTDTPTPPETKVEDEKKGEDDEEIEPPKGAHPDIKKGYSILKGKLKAEKQRLADMSAENAKLKEDLVKREAEYKDKLLTKEISEELESLRDMRRTYFAENDPTLRAEFDNRLAEIDRKALDVLLSEGLAPDMAKFISGRGGLMRLYTSRDPMPAPYSHQNTKEFVEETLLAGLTSIGRKRLEQQLAAGLDVQYDYTQEIQKAKAGGSELQKKKQQELEKAFAESVAQAKARFGKAAERQEYPPNATDADRARVDKHNKLLDSADKRLEEFIRDGGKDPRKLAEALVEASRSQYLMEDRNDKEKEIEQSRARIAELEKKIEDIKKSGSTGRPSAAPPPTSKPTLGKLMSDDEAITQFLAGTR